MGKLFIGKYGKLTDMTFVGEFESNICKDGELIKQDGTTTQGEMRMHFTRGFTKHELKFYTREQIAIGADHSVVIYLNQGEAEPQVKKFDQFGKAKKFYKGLNEQTNIIAQGLFTDMKIYENVHTGAKSIKGKT